MYNRDMKNNLTIITVISRSNTQYDLVAIQDVFTGKVHWQGSRHAANKMFKLLQK